MDWGGEKYREPPKLIWSFIDIRVIDYERGEWFTKLNRLGESYRVDPPDDPSPYYRNDRKAYLWKRPHHNGRMCLETIARIDALPA
jgi:mannobiose 2-epimerase